MLGRARKPLVLPFVPDRFTRYQRAHLLARALDVSNSTMERWCAGGAIPGAVKRGRFWGIPLEVAGAIVGGELQIDPSGTAKADRRAK